MFKKRPYFAVALNFASGLMGSFNVAAASFADARDRRDDRHLGIEGDFEAAERRLVIIFETS